MFRVKAETKGTTSVNDRGVKYCLGTDRETRSYEGILKHFEGFRYIVDKDLSLCLTTLGVTLVYRGRAKKKQMQIKDIFTITLSTSDKKVLVD